MGRVLRSIFPKNLILELRDLAEEALGSYFSDYFSSGSFLDFQRDQLGHTSVAMKAVAWRFVGAGILEQLRDHAATRARDEGLMSGEILIHPVFYLRFTWPNVVYSDAYGKAFLDSHPHYDRTFGLAARSFWTPLESVSEDTGGICVFNDERVLDLFPYNDRNSYNADGYLEAAATLDPLLRQTVVAPRLDVGDAFTFDGSVLHGATKPRCARRVSLDFRLCQGEDLAQTSDWVQRLVREFNASPDLSNARNLIAVGDTIGASRLLHKIASADANASLEAVATTLALAPPHPSLLAKHAQLAWQREYAWARPA